MVEIRTKSKIFQQFDHEMVGDQEWFDGEKIGPILYLVGLFLKH